MLNQKFVMSVIAVIIKQLIGKSPNGQLYMLYLQCDGHIMPKVGLPLV